MPNAVAFTSINVIRNHAQRGNLDAKIFGHRGSAILRAVVHHQNFGVEPSGRKVLRLPATLERIAEYLATAGLHAEVLVVDDGSKDGTAGVAEYFCIKIPTLRVVSNDVNRGKGYSVRHGMKEARGRIALFTDADLSAPIEEAGKLMEALETFDVAIGSRAIDRSLISVHESPFREFAGIIFNKIVRVILWLPFVDTQCGFKEIGRA